jgi:asparagine synthase (glutamine-hydrolysing)
MRFWTVADREEWTMGLLCGCWIFNDTLGGSALDKLQIAGGSDADAKNSVIATDGPCFLLRDFQFTSLPGPSLISSDSRRSLFVAWDGRLDNRQELARELGESWSTDREDVDFVAAAFGKWQTGAFERMRGDWAVTIWNARERTLILAKDPMGIRPLFYSLTPHGVLWSNSLDWLVRQAGTLLKLNLEYLAGWLSFFPAAHVTPYARIDAVPPSSSVKLRPGCVTIRKYWEFQPADILRYPSDFEYEEQFRSVLANSIRRRLRSNTPLLAELSGGMDSSSIVCVADAILAHEHGLTPRLDTISYYDDNEPNWDEYPFFSLVEAKRGRPGLHVSLDAAHDLDGLFEAQEFTVTPAKFGRTRGKQSLLQSLEPRSYSAILSGIGGDEFTGGVPTPIPELADLLAAGRLPSLARSLKYWSLFQRSPWIHVLFDTLRSFAPFRSSPNPVRRPPAWLDPQFRTRYQSVLSGYEQPLQVWGPRPSFQENIFAVEGLRRQVAVSNQSPGELEKRYPYLDVDLLQFLFAVPREQLVQPGRRRSLMRRALAGIVPHEILERKRKAYVTRAPRTALAARWEDVQGLTHQMLAESLGIVSSRGFREALESVRGGKDTAILPLQRMLVLESWLRQLAEEGMFSCNALAQQPGDKNSPRPCPLEHGGNASFG